jgi:predicted nuclease of predicted toxin-antitoxin system
MRILADENVHTGIIQGLNQANFEVLSVLDIGFAGHKDREILEYSEENDLILISGDKDFGGLIEFGTLWGRGKVVLLRYHIININRIVKDIVEVINREVEILDTPEPVVIVLSESGYRIHKAGRP